MTTKNFIYSLNRFEGMVGIGANWVDRVQKYFPFGSWIQKASTWQIAFWGMGNVLGIDFKTIPFFIIVILLIIKFYGMILINWMLGKKMQKTNIYATEKHFNAKNEELNPVQAEMFKTIENIAMAVNAKSEFTKL